jgi:hypothetical protein
MKSVYVCAPVSACVYALMDKYTCMHMCTFSLSTNTRLVKGSWIAAMTEIFSVREK